MDVNILVRLYQLDIFLFNEETAARIQSSQCTKDEDEDGSIFFMGKLVALQEARDQLNLVIMALKSGE